MIPAWARHESDSSWHLVVGAEYGGSIMTACNGRWSSHDGYAVSVLPPQEHKCEGCTRVVIEAGAR